MTELSKDSRAMLTRRQLLVRAGAGAAALSLAPILAACSGGSSEAGGGGAPAATSAPSGGASGGSAAGSGGHTVEMTDQMKFEPESITIKKGETITWVNAGAIMHTATCDPAKAINAENAKLPEGAQPWDSGNVEAGASWSHTFDVAGEYTYNCTPHEAAGMVGHITVTE